jgi:hypothetical protein
MANRWEDVEDLFLKTAEDDLLIDGVVQPALAAFAGDQLRFLAWLRWFPKGQYEEPFIELLSLAMPLDADRLAVSLSGRAWSLDDPIPPVTEDVDLRQRALVLHSVDGGRGRPRTTSVLRPFDLVDGRVEWGERLEQSNVAGWIPEALELSVRRRRRLATSVDEIRKQAERVVNLGHSLYLAPEVAARLLPAGPPRDMGSRGPGRGRAPHRHRARVRRSRRA